MQILPAIDLRGGRCVRLRQGDYSQETIFADDPLEVAQKWVDLGSEYLHLVDLDGAKAGQPVNGEIVKRIASSIPIPCQVGGGLRTEEHIQMAFSWGVQRVILGTRALDDPDWVQKMVQTYPGRIVLGLDARDGKIATHGWTATSEVSVRDMIREFTGWPLAAIVYTDIARDGMLTGPNVPALSEVSRLTAIPIIASGGVSTLDHIRELLKHRLSGCIIGRALYEGQLDLSAVLSLVRAEAS